MSFTHIVPYDSVAFACACELKISIRMHCSDCLSCRVYYCLCAPLDMPFADTSGCGTRKKQAAWADRRKTDSLHGGSDDCIREPPGWSTLISPRWAAPCYWGRPCASASLRCARRAEPAELTGDGREIRKKREEGRTRRMDYVPRCLMRIILSHEWRDSLK